MFVSSKKYIQVCTYIYIYIDLYCVVSIEFYTCSFHSSLLHQLFDTVWLPIHDTALVHVLQGLGNCEMI